MFTTTCLDIYPILSYLYLFMLSLSSAIFYNDCEQKIVLCLGAALHLESSKKPEQNFEEITDLTYKCKGPGFYSFLRSAFNRILESSRAKQTSKQNN